MSFEPGALINGKYRLVRLLGEGGMGTIYEARHEFLGTEVALKFLHPALSSRPNVVARFVQEARVSANIKSPHVVTVIDVDQSPQGLAFLVMELLRGEPLATRLARQATLPLSLAVSIAAQVLLALETAHALGVVHRDMKPENVFLTEAPGNAAANRDGLLVKILDFGIAKLRTLGEVRAELTKPGMVMGTPEYMAPEQVFAADAVDARADLYALGAMLFEMLAGRRPVQGDDPRGIAAAVLSGQTPRLETLAPRVPGAIADVVAIALAAKPDDRFSSATAMRQALAHAAVDAQIDVDLPPPPRRKPTAAGAPLTPAESPVLGSVGLGVAPPAMMGPGSVAAMAAYDAQRAAPLIAAQAPANVHATQPQAPSAASLGLVPAEPLAERPRADTIDEAPHRVPSPSETIAALPTPYAPPVAPLPPVASPAPAHAEPPRAGPGAGETAAGFVPPFDVVTPPDFGSTAIGPSHGPREAERDEAGGESSVPRAGARRSALPMVLIGLVVVVVGVIVAAASGGFGGGAPSTAPTASVPEAPSSKPKKPVVIDDEPPVDAGATVDAGAQTAGKSITPKPRGSGIGPKPSAVPSAWPSTAVSPSVAPLPSLPSIVHPAPSGSEPGDIYTIPLPGWPVH